MKYLSPNSLRTWIEDPEKYYCTYMAVNRMPRTPQTGPMAIGSAFDAFVKSHLHQGLYGHYGADIDHPCGERGPAYLPDLIFRDQVAPEHHSWAWEAGREVFDGYVKSGALTELLREMEGSNDVSFELTLTDAVSCSIGSVTFLGKPDVFFRTASGRVVVLDWKVNGYFSKASPKPGAVRPVHKDSILKVIDGITVNIGHPLEIVDVTWANQCTIYAWLLGAPIGSDFIIGIEQLCGEKGTRIVSHRSLVSRNYQVELFAQAEEAWRQIQIIEDDMANGTSNSTVIPKARRELLDLMDYSDDPLFRA
jgi:hypothetical protein